MAKDKKKMTMKRKSTALDTDSSSTKRRGEGQRGGLSPSSAAQKDLIGKKRKESNTDAAALATPFSKRRQALGDELDEEDFGLETQHLLNTTKDHQSSDFETTVFEDGRLRIRPDISLEGPQYAGRSIGRSAAFAEDNESESSELGTEQNGREAFDNDLQGQDFDSEEEQHSAQGLLSETLNEEMDALNKEYLELQAEEQEMLRGLKGRSDEDMEKGQAVSHQKALWDKALELRILLQKPFSSVNRLPKEDVKTMICENNTEVKEAFSRLTASSIETLRCLSELFEALLEKNATVNEGFIPHVNGENNAQKDNDVASLSKSSDAVDELWQQLGSLHSRFVPFRNSSVDRWQRKTQLSSGAAVSKSKLRAFNQSITQQIETYMRDPSRMLQRMWLKPSSVNILGMPLQCNNGQSTASPDNAITPVNNKEVDGDPELIDDTEFYQELLHEFLESSDPAAIGNLYAVRKLQNKKRKVVDRRASKGRKIRYNVHEKIVNFMAPVPMNLPPMAEKLFSNLFGQRS